MKKIQYFKVIAVLLFGFALIFTTGACATSKNSHGRKRSQNYLHHRNDRPKWNSTRATKTTYVIKSNKKTKRLPY
jgi:hypothetical protein